jgi:hypothetical protein
MRYKSIHQIAKDFNAISGILQNDSETKDLLEQSSNEIKTLKLWANEFKSNKNSIYVVGKTSTGKSEFHNLILDIADSKLRLFKTSTKVETSVLQTLQHCESLDQAYAEISIKSVHEWSKLNKNQLNEFGIQMVNQEETIKIKLTSLEEISFLRDVIMAKSRKGDPFNISKAAHSINIFFPLKYFKNHKFIDTPGLGSHESGTDDSVRNEFQGKSHILWLLDASQRTLSDSLTLLEKEKEFLKNNIHKTIFIGNKFDIPENDDDVENFHYIMAKELRSTFLNGVQNIFKLDEIPQDIILTSFKLPNRKFANQTTIDVIKSLENKFLLDDKHVTFNNVEAFVDTLNSVLVKLKINIEGEKTETLKKNITKATYEVKRLSKEEKLIKKDIKTVVPGIIQGYIAEIENIKKDKNLNTHDKYNSYLGAFTKTIKNTHSKLIYLARAKLSTNSIKLNLKLEDYKKIDDFSLKHSEGFIKKYLHDKELDSKKQKLLQYANSKIQTIKQIEKQIIEELYQSQNKHSKNIEKEHNSAIYLLQRQKDLDKVISLIVKVIDKLENHNYLLLEEVEEKIYSWGPKNADGSSKDVLDSFLNLNYLLDEHIILKQRITK